MHVMHSILNNRLILTFLSYGFVNTLYHVRQDLILMTKMEIMIIISVIVIIIIMIMIIMLIIIITFICVH